MITSISFQCAIHSLCYYLTKYFSKKLGFVELSNTIWIAVFLFLLLCLLLVYFVSAAGCHCFDLTCPRPLMKPPSASNKVNMGCLKLKLF